MAKAPSKAAKPPRAKVVIRYENLDAVRPAHVDGAQGLVNSQGILNLSFYSEYFAPKEEIRLPTTVTMHGDDRGAVQAGPADPFGMDAGAGMDLTITRHIEASVALTRGSLENLITFLQTKLDEIVGNQGERNETAH